jgi:hypothetical protein
MGIAITELASLVLLVIVAVFIFVGFSTNWQFIEGIKACPGEGDPVPVWKFWCRGEKEKSYYDLVAEDSVNYLACAIESVAKGRKECGGAEGLPLEGASVSCSGEAICCGIPSVWNDIPGVGRVPVAPWEYKWADNQAKCEELEGVEVDKSLCPEEERPLFTCTVENFQLPQDVTKAEEWIGGMGDPQFLTYYQNFPEGEDSAWASMSEWYKGSTKLLFGSLCAASIGGGLLGAVRKPGRAMGAITEFLEKSLSGFRRVGTAGIGIVKPSTRAATIASLKTMLKPSLTGTSSFSKSYAAAKKLAPAAFGAAVRAATATTSAYYLSRFDTELGKFFEKPKQLVLQKALLLSDGHYLDMNPESPDENSLVGMGPVVLLANKESGFYLASPCQANLDVSKKAAECSLYSYSSVTGEVHCYDAELKDSSSMPRCSMGEIAGLESARMMKDIEKVEERGIFSYGEDGMLGSISFPLAPRGGRLEVSGEYSIRNIRKQESPCVGVGHEGENVCYTADIYRGEEKIASIPEVSPNAFGYPDTSQDSFFVCGDTSSVYPAQHVPFYFAQSGNLIVDGWHEDSTYCDIRAEDSGNMIVWTSLFTRADKENILEGEERFYSQFLVSGGNEMFVFKDENGDGEWETVISGKLGGFEWKEMGINLDYLALFSDSDGDRLFDTVILGSADTGNKCQVPAIAVEVDENSMRTYSEGGKDNFCYTREREYVRNGAIALSFVLSAVGKRVPHPFTFLVSTAVDCSLWYLSDKYATPAWPG